MLSKIIAFAGRNSWQWVLQIAVLGGVLWYMIKKMSSSEQDIMAKIDALPIDESVKYVANQLSQKLIFALGTGKTYSSWFEEEGLLSQTLHEIPPDLYKTVDVIYQIKSKGNRSIEQDVLNLLSRREARKYLPSWLKSKYGVS